MKRTTKFQYITLILVIALCYLFRYELFVGGLYLYSKTGSADAERMLGEYYSEKSMIASRRATIHFQEALYRYKIALPLAPKEQQQWIEFLIGTHYECGRGVPEDLKEARSWYRSSAEKGFKPSKDMLKRVDQALQKTTGTTEGPKE